MKGYVACLLQQRCEGRQVQHLSVELSKGDSEAGFIVLGSHVACGFCDVDQHVWAPSHLIELKILFHNP